MGDEVGDHVARGVTWRVQKYEEEKKPKCFTECKERLGTVEHVNSQFYFGGFGVSLLTMALAGAVNWWKPYIVCDFLKMIYEN